MSIAKRKSVQAILVLLIVTAIILAGAFAWYSFTQNALNIFEGWTNPDVNLHDDFDAPNKDVYVENSGQRPLYVRVRFDEYMEIDGTRITSGNGTKEDWDTWVSHGYYGMNDAHLCEEECHKYYTWAMGNATGDIDDPNNGWKYYMPSPYTHRALFDRDGYQINEPKVNAYDESLVDNDLKVRYGLFDGFDPKLVYVEPPTVAGVGQTNTKQTESPEEAYNRIDATLKEVYAGTSATLTGFADGAKTKKQYLDAMYAALDAETDAGDRADIQAEIDQFLIDEKLGYWDITYTLRDIEDNEYYTPSNRPNDKRPTTPVGVTFSATRDLVDPVQKFVPIKRTLTTTQVYTMSQWIAAGMPTGDFWVMDEDGWCYWANVLLPGQTSGLLMSEVLLNQLNPPAGVWYYGINVSLQAVTADDIGRFALKPADEADGMGGGITELGQMVLDSVSSKYVFGVAAAGVETLPGGSLAVKPDATFSTYQKFGDNTYRLVTPNGNSFTYGPLFIYTGATSASAEAMRGIYDRYTPVGSDTVNGTDTSEYKVGNTFWKQTSLAPPKYEKFTVVDAKQGTAMNNSNVYTGVIEAKNGKHYVKLGYGTYIDPTTPQFGESGQPSYGYDESGYEKIAWLAVGENGVFDSHVANNSKAPTPALIIPAPAIATDRVSDNDDVLIWTESEEPGIAGDRYVEKAPVDAVKVGDVLTAKFGAAANSKIDGHEWLVIGQDANNSQTNTGKTLLIMQDVSAPVAAGDIATTLPKYVLDADPLLLTDLKAADSGITPTLLTVQEAMDYFANNSARGAGTKWWVDDGEAVTSAAINTNGSFGADTTGNDVGLRVAFWIDTAKLNNLIYGTPVTP